MPVKSKKVLETENSSLKDEVKNLKIKNSTLTEQYETLKAKCSQENVMKNINFKCSNCDKSFKTYKDFKKHKSEHEVNNEVYECSQCDKTFNEDWKMNAHIKTHKKFKCDKCDKSFKFLELLTKHIKISHENVKLYCHFFNNKKVCPFKEECLFLHEEADTCTCFVCLSMNMRMMKTLVMT